MPVLLDEEDEERWLSYPVDEGVTPAKLFPSQLMSVQQAPDPRAVNCEAGGRGGSNSADQTSFILE